MKQDIAIRIVALALAGGVAASASAATELSFGGLGLPAVRDDASSADLHGVYVIDNGAGRATVSYTADASGNVVEIQRYGSDGSAYASAVPGVQRDGATYTWTVGTEDTGFIVNDGGRLHAWWVTNYDRHRLDLQGVNINSEMSACDRTALSATGAGDAITYYSTTSRPLRIGRDITAEYRTLAWDEGAGSYVQTTATKTFDALGEAMYIDAPLCDTEVTLSGDRFLRAWNMEQSATTPTLTARAVEAHTSATQDQEEIDNQIKNQGSGALGGSAPAVVTFSASVSDAAVFHEWQMSRDADFNDVFDRYSELVLTHTFDEEGTIYVRFMADNAEGTCPWYSDTYEVSIGASRLLCPNAFSPANEDGVNDIWKVSYTSIVTFECNIFNRWGTKMATLTHPSQGWDGKYKGKFVPSGVYFYVIRARGADGKEYNLSGDINIIGSRRATGGTSSEGGGE